MDDEKNAQHLSGLIAYYLAELGLLIDHAKTVRRDNGAWVFYYIFIFHGKKLGYSFQVARYFIPHYLDTEWLIHQTLTQRGVAWIQGVIDGVPQPYPQDLLDQQREANAVFDVFARRNAYIVYQSFQNYQRRLNDPHG